MTLAEACASHTSGHLIDDVTAQICWDADRLDIGRIGIAVNPYFLNTSAAKTMVAAHGFVPPLPAKLRPTLHAGISHH